MSEVALRKRDVGIDLCKAILITLVVLGHAIQYSGDGTASPLFRFIYSFHMAAFMMVSGFVGFNKPLALKSVVKKLKRLLIPFFAWWLLCSLIFVLPKQGLIGLSDSFVSLLTCPATGLWFFWDLSFLILMLWGIQVLSRYIRVNETLTFVALWGILEAISKTLGLVHFNISSIARYMPFFMIGYLLSKRKRIFAPNKRMGIFLSVLVVLFISLECVYMVSKNIPGAGVALSLLGSICLLGVCTNVCDSVSRFSAGISFLGANTLGIYAIHMSMCRYLPGIVNGWGVIVCFVVLMVASLSATELIGRCSFLRALLLGR